MGEQMKALNGFPLNFVQRLFMKNNYLLGTLGFIDGQNPIQS